VNTHPLAPEEWDFRTVKEWELPTVLQYEYARSCARLRRAIEKWHQRPFELEYLTQNDWDESAARLCSILGKGKPLTNAQAIGIAFDDARREDPDRIALTFFFLSLSVTLPAAVTKMKGDNIAMRFEEFPEPWLATKKRRGDEHLRQRSILLQKRDRGIWSPGRPADDIEIRSLNPSLKREELLIDWSKSKEQLACDFKLWLTENHPGVPEGTRRRTGSRATWERLKWLAAFRLVQSGLKFAVAKKFVDDYLKQNPNKGDVPNVTPNYKFETAWNDVVKRVKADLGGDFMSAILEDFGSLPPLAIG